MQGGNTGGKLRELVFRWQGPPGAPSDLSHLFRTFCARRVSTEHQWCWLFAYAARCQFGWDGNKMPWNWQIVHELKFKIDQGFVVPLTCASQTFSVTQIANATNATEKHCRHGVTLTRWAVEDAEVWMVSIRCCTWELKPRMFFWKSSNKLSKNSQKKRDAWILDNCINLDWEAGLT